MGIDYGSKRVGIAFTNEDGTMAFPHDTLPNDGELLKKLEALIEEKAVGEIVIGHSLNLDGEENAVMEQVKELMTDLTLAVGVPVHLEPEQFTTQEAKRIQGKNAKTDASAAAIILNSFITRNQ